MRTVEFETIAEAVADAAIDAGRVLPEDVLAALAAAHDRETAPIAKEILERVIENARIAREHQMPLCQDCGLAVCFVRIGSEVRVAGGGIADAINEGVRRGYERGYLRKSVLNDPLKRMNTDDNTPAVIHFDIVGADELTIGYMAKGGGCENMSRTAMLTPADGRDGVIEFVVKTVRKAGGNPCPPIIVGVGIGGTLERAALLAKRTLLRRLDEHNDDADLAALEAEILDRVNALGIGPQGMGGNTTALGVHVEAFPCHIASLPVAVNIECHSHRTRRIVL
ncbi:MAG: fumarate hydratase [Planctomycetes bacterium]|nr:fumarate hydratase [Planctomycetota bacterium]